MTALTLRIDPHVHSAASFDATASIDTILRRARAVGLDGVVITDHDELDASLEAAERAAEFGLVGIPGVEVSTAVGHLLALGVERRPERGLPLAETVRQIRAQGGVAVVPHPFQRSRHGIRKSDLGDVDGIEVYNGLAMTGYRNRCARLFAIQRGYPMIGGSDAHTPDLIGRTYTEIVVDTPADRPANVSTSAVLDGLKAGATRVEGRRTPLSRYVRKHAWHAEYRTSMALRAGVGALVTRLV